MTAVRCPWCLHVHMDPTWDGVSVVDCRCGHVFVVIDAFVSIAATVRRSAATVERAAA